MPFWKRQFWDMSGTLQTSRDRMVLNMDLPPDIGYPICSGKALPRRPRTFLAQIRRAPRIADIPWCIPLVVSRKVRDIMMDIDGRYLKAYPVRLERPVGVEYFVMHCVRVVSCQISPEALGRTYLGINPVVIDPARVPQDTHVFHPRVLPTVLVVTDVMRNAILQAGCTEQVFHPSQQWPLDPDWRPLVW